MFNARTADVISVLKDGKSWRWAPMSRLGFGRSRLLGRLGEKSGDVGRLGGEAAAYKLAPTS